MSSFDLLTIGHSNLPAGRFIAMLRAAAVNTVADVRSLPVSRHCPWFSKTNLAAALAAAGIGYAAMGRALGGRPRDAALYRDGVADYEAMAVQAGYRAGVEQLIGAAAHARIGLMCAEREPLDCHRCLLVARSLAVRGLAVGHILPDGTIEPHAATERRLLALTADGADLFAADPFAAGPFAAGQHERLAAAYRRRARAVAFRQRRRTADAAAEMR